MSGPESIPEHPDDRDDGRPLSPEAADHGPEPRHAPAWDRDPEAEPVEDAEGDAPKAKPWARLVALLSAVRLPALSWPFGFPSLGSERHEVLPPLPHEPASAPGTGSVRAESGPEPERATAIGRLASRIPALSMKRETRVGLAAAVTLVFLVAGLAANKGWLGGFRSPLLALDSSSKTGLDKPPKPDAPAPPATPEVKGGEAEKKKPEPATASTASKARLPQDNADRNPPKYAPVTPLNPPPPASEESAKAEPDRLAAPEIPSGGLDAGLPASSPAPPDPASPPAGDAPLNLPGDKAEAAPKTSPTPPDPMPAMPAMPGEAPATAGASAPLPAPEAGPEPSLPLPSMPAEPVAPAQPAPPSASTPAPAEPTPAPPSASTPAPAEPTPAPPVAEAPPQPRAAEPLPAERTPPLEQVPAPSPDPMAPAVAPATSAPAGPGWVLVRNGGKRPPAGDPASGGSGGLTVISQPLQIPDGPAPAADPAVADQVEPVVHEVRSGENFFTISRLYYKSGRYYKALHAANARQVPDIAGLVVGTKIRVPPPEALDRSLILPPGRGSATVQASADRAAAPASRNSRAAEPADEVPVASSRRPRVARPEPDPEARDEPDRPTYRVKAHETLRSIARDTLDDAHRDREILNLNREVVVDPNTLPVGTTLILPADAVVGRRGR